MLFFCFQKSSYKKPSTSDEIKDFSTYEVPDFKGMDVQPLQFLQVEENSIPTEQVLKLISKHLYETVPSLNDVQYKQLLKKQCNLEAVFLEKNHSLSFEQSEGTDIELSCCAACITYFGLSIEQLATVFMQNIKK